MQPNGNLTFNYFDTRNNWWWAIDNLEVNTGPAVTPGATLSYATDANGNLVITYTGANEYTGHLRPPAVPLAELIDAIDLTSAGTSVSVLAGARAVRFRASGTCRSRAGGR